MATSNISGINRTKVRDDMEISMSRKQHRHICFTRNQTKSRQQGARKEYTWFFSGEGEGKEYTAGVGKVMNVYHTPFIQDIESISDRLMYVTITRDVEINIVAAYQPPADRPEEKGQACEACECSPREMDKEETGDHYTLQAIGMQYECIHKQKQKKVQWTKHTAHTDGECVDRFISGMLDCRDRLIELAVANARKTPSTIRILSTIF